MMVETELTFFELQAQRGSEQAAKLRHAHLGDANSVSLERLPNQLAAHANSRIIVA